VTFNWQELLAVVASSALGWLLNWLGVWKLPKLPP